MSQEHIKLLEYNKQWVKETLELDPNYFTELAKGQKPEFLWVGCADSRVPANVITGTKSGDIFVHRNIANVVLHTDSNCMSVLHYAVEVLKVRHIIVCGHYSCGGIKAAMSNKDHGLVVNKWLRNIKEVYAKHSNELDAIEDTTERSNRLTELNVIESVINLAKTSIIQSAWDNHEIKIHGWVYGIDTGIIKDLNVMVQETADLEPIFRYEKIEKL
ncbi:MAG: carbonic anhydrase [Candidatus Kapabacteria bacterium]|nr:carbonic anhydrase [Ignavibacteriota bacterium]MCW5885177.1 carbonic anhydrase [Candidatus Kapabacteria bacterium]